MKNVFSGLLLAFVLFFVSCTSEKYYEGNFEVQGQQVTFTEGEMKADMTVQVDQLKARLEVETNEEVKVKIQEYIKQVEEMKVLYSVDETVLPNVITFTVNGQETKVIIEKTEEGFRAGATTSGQLATSFDEEGLNVVNYKKVKSEDTL